MFKHKLSTAVAFVGLLALTFIAPVHATNLGGSLSGSVGIFAGQVGAVASSKTSGGTLSEATSNSNGVASNTSYGTGGGNAAAGGAINSTGVSVFTSQSSFGTAVSNSAQIGSSTANGTTQHGTDVASEAVGNFSAIKVGGSIGGGFSAFKSH